MKTQVKKCYDIKLLSNTNQYHIGVVTLPPEYTVELQQRTLPSYIGNKSSVTDVIVIGPFLENRPPPSPGPRPAPSTVVLVV
jgi:hypothetical protein